MIKFFSKNLFAILVFVLAFLVYLPFYYQFSGDLGLSSILSEDQQAYISNIFYILYPEKFGGKQYWEHFLYFAYGPLFWSLPAFFALPFKLINFEPGVLLTIYFVPFACFAGIIYVLTLIFKIINLGKENLFYRFLAILLIFLCLTTPIILGNTLQIRAEIILSFFSILSFYFLLLDNNSFQKNYYLSVVFFSISLCIKLLSILVGIIFLLYFIYNRSKLTVKIVTNSIFLSLIVIAIGYLPLWFSESVHSHIKNVEYYSSITLTGWPQDHVVKSYNNSISFFNGIYFNFYSLCSLLIAALLLIIYQFKNNHKSNILIYLISACVVVLLYLICVIFVTFAPNNYGILIPIFTPIVAIMMLKEVSSIRSVWFKNIILIITCIFIVIMINNFINQKRWNFVKPGLSPFQEKVMKAQNDIRSYLTYNNNFKHPCIDKQLSILKINGKRIDYSSFGEVSLNDNLLSKCDLFIFWDESRVSNFLVAKNGQKETDPIIKNTQTNYQKILDKNNFMLLYDKNNIRIFKKKLSKI